MQSEFRQQAKIALQTEKTQEINNRERERERERDRERDREGEKERERL